MTQELRDLQAIGGKLREAATLFDQVATVCEDHDTLRRQRDEARDELATVMRQRDAEERRAETFFRSAIAAEDQVADLRAERDALDSARKQAEAKVVDIGWRKNRLVEAAQAKGFVVEWQQDGSSELLTKEEVAQREEAKRQAEKPKPIISYAELMKEMSRITDDKLRDEFNWAFFRPAPFMARDPFTYSVSFDLGAPTPSVKPVDAPKPMSGADRFISEKPKPEPTAEDYYQRAENRAVAYRIWLCSYKSCGSCATDRKKLDEALREELKSHPEGKFGVCESDPDCPAGSCQIWHKRPWK